MSPRVAKEIARGLRAFSRDAAMVSDLYENFIGEYDGQWIAFRDGGVRASAPSLPELLHEMDRLCLPRQSTVVRFITSAEPTLIL
jgi:hypothetical protein